MQQGVKYGSDVFRALKLAEGGFLTPEKEFLIIGMKALKEVLANKSELCTEADIACLESVGDRLSQLLSKVEERDPPLIGYGFPGAIESLHQSQINADSSRILQRSENPSGTNRLMSFDDSVDNAMDPLEKFTTLTTDVMSPPQGRICRREKGAIGSKLKGRASQALPGQINQYESVGRFLDDSKAQFGTTGGLASVKAEMRVIRQERNEKAAAYGHRVQKMYNKLLSAYDTDQDLEKWEKRRCKSRAATFALDQFIYGLLEPLQHHVEAGHPETLYEAISDASKIEIETDARRQIDVAEQSRDAEGTLKEIDNRHNLKLSRKFEALQSGSKFHKQNNLIGFPTFPSNQPVENHSIVPLRNKWLTNMSDTPLPQEVRNILSLGETFNFTVPLQKSLVFEFLKGSERFLTRYQDIFYTDFVRNDLIKSLDHYLKNSNRVSYQDRIIFNSIKKTSKFLKDNPNLLVTKADKGNSTVIISKDEYKRKMLDMLSDPKYYRKIEDNPLKSLTKSMEKLIATWRSKKALEDLCFKSVSEKLDNFRLGKQVDTGISVETFTISQNKQRQRMIHVIEQVNESITDRSCPRRAIES
ncbi:hypothetical protein QAD02_013615 [Eretmocerus hayati]|uniref:Uncharacterized protein n=1 Tax=Eretmocerus hayati TaxID=131215 RepID=A0ACC2P2Y1_9HYME|nr:hypothetical protein QAD02_013615 [Eretmocerus hayati]